MKFKTLVMTMCALAAFTVTSCKDEPVEPTPTPDAATITVSPTSLSFDAAGASKDLTVKSNADWTVTVPADASWLTVSAKSGSKDGSVKVTAAANAGAAGAAAAAREAKLTFAVEGKKVDVTVSQAAEAIVFVVSGDTAVVPAAGGQVSVKVEYNESYTVGTLPEWITAATKATKTDNLSFAVAANEASAERTADITFSSASGKTDKVTVKQAAAEVKTKSLSTVQDILDFAAASFKLDGENPTAADTLAYMEFDPDGDGIFKLEADIDLSGIDWVPFNFFGVFDGQNHRVYNIVSANKNGNSGFISFVRPGSTVKNLCVGSKDFDFATKKGTYDGKSSFTVCYEGDATSYFYAGALAYVNKNSFVENVVNFAPVTAAETYKNNTRIGGVMGTMKAAVSVKDCINFGDISYPALTSGTATPGGISGYMDGADSKMEGCINYGNVTTAAPGSTYFGGIVPGAGSNAGEMKSCINYGDVIFIGNPAKQSYIGGIISYAKGAFSITDCHNYGKVSFASKEACGFNVYVGGVIGSAEVTGTEVKDCSNEGEVSYACEKAQSAGDITVGGIVGRQVTNACKLTNCVNKGKVIASTDGINVWVGGVLGRTHQASVIKNCVNEGEIVFSANATGILYEGGVVAYNQQASCTFIECINKGAVKSTGTCPAQYLGSVQGWNQGNHAGVLQSGCQALGSVSCAQNSPKCYVGGLLGFFNTSTAVSQIIEKSIVNCTLESAVAATSTNSANVCENAGLVVGGFAGQAAGKTVTFGTAEEPLKVMGKVNDVTVTDGELSVATSYKNYLTGNGSVNSVAGGSADHVIYAVFADAKPVNDIPDVNFNNPGVTL